ncbi:hypothetical protein [Streptomyces aurantiogriseus]|uniref:hypothetical protein n=1 Tax=Streptomyces aurantiogriseus TaxID=66870 RepID=UPI001672847F|nr:hypothetical protein [Streptomyces aurantiogriseus]
MRKPGISFRTAGIGAAAACLSPALTDCGSPDTTAPGTVHAEPATTAQTARFGTVDCRRANGTKSE